MIGFAFDQDDGSRIHPVLVDAQMIQHQVAQLMTVFEIAPIWRHRAVQKNVKAARVLDAEAFFLIVCKPMNFSVTREQIFG